MLIIWIMLMMLMYAYVCNKMCIEVDDILLMTYWSHDSDDFNNYSDSNNLNNYH
jgi:hypothetical protein